MSWAGETHWRPGARLARLRSSHGYGWVLLLVMVTFVFAASAPDRDWSRGLFVLIECATLALALWTSGLSRDLRVVAVLGIVAIGGIVLSLATTAGPNSQA